MHQKKGGHRKLRHIQGNCKVPQVTWTAEETEVNALQLFSASVSQNHKKQES